MLKNGRQKYWYDSKVRTKEFQKGDLVLVFTLKKHKRKLKMRGLGPYVINEITSGGAVCLETLDGEPMANFINGSSLKRFHEPLTQEMLERMHAAKTRKEALETMKSEAQEEARQRAAKAKARRHQVFAVTSINNKDADYIPPMLLEVGIDGTNNTCIALLDSGAVVNVMVEHVYKKFVVNPLTPTTIQLNTASNQAIACKGMVMVSTSIGEHKEECHFHVTDNKESAHDIILGCSWMHKHRCQFDWDKRTITVALCNQSVVLPVAAEATSTTKETPLATSVATTVSTRKRITNHAKNFAATQVVSTKASIHKRWLPKKLLQAQHFYEGNNLIWIPKQRQTPVNAGFIPQDSQQVRKVIPQTRWLPQAHNFYQKNNYSWVL